MATESTKNDSEIRRKIRHRANHPRTPPDGIRRKFRSPSIYAFAFQRLCEIENEIKRKNDLGKEFELKEEYFLIDTPDFLIGDPGSRLVKKSAYQEQVSRMFEHLAEFRRAKWTVYNNGNNDVAEKHALTEIESLRSEIVDLKSLITSSERVTAVWMVGSVFAYSKDIISLFPILLVPFLLATFGFVRFKEFQRNVFDLDCYLRELELVVRPDAGWVTYFFRTRIMERFFDTRKWFWIAAIIISAGIPILSLAELLSPQAVRMSFSEPSDPIRQGFLDWLRGN